MKTSIVPQIVPVKIVRILKRNLSFVKLGVLLSIYLISSNSYTQSQVVWSYDAMAAVPALPAVKNDLYRVLWGRVLFREGKTGTINLFCPITEGTGKFRTLHLTYRDGDGHRGPSEVSAALRRVHKNGDAPVTFKYGLVSSNDDGNLVANELPAPNSGPSGWATHSSMALIRTMLDQDHNLDFENYYYYVQITMKRTNPDIPLGVIGVYLTK